MSAVNDVWRAEEEMKCLFSASHVSVKLQLLWAGSSSSAFWVTPQITTGHFVVLFDDIVWKDGLVGDSRWAGSSQS